MTNDELLAMIIALRNILGTTISWIAHSANSPISHDEAIELLRRLDEEIKIREI